KMGIMMTKKKANKIVEKETNKITEAPAVQVSKPLTRADEIWNHIKNVQLEMFALPNQTVSLYCQPIVVEPTKLYLKYKAAAVYPALETALQKLYTVEMVNKLIIIADKKVTI
ncbi:MAG TPA: hypothetical protein VNW06_11290, partial [Cytophagaceae bacterium]|nr:hypothetical protein [Cytophagaceae bacterium]